MKVKVADYIADFLAEHQIDTVFTVVGGGSMHLNDAFGHHPKLRCIYQHHEQACSMAAEGYARMDNRMAAVCVTSGPGAINALNGVAGAYMDSIPMLVFSGQAKTELTVRHHGLGLRTLGNQEFDIISALGRMTKYCEMVEDPANIRYCLERAFTTAVSGRPGPCWLDIPLDVQGAAVETEMLEGYRCKDSFAAVGLSYGTVEEVAGRIRSAQRPVLYAGNGIRLAGAQDGVEPLARLAGMAVVTCWDSIDLLPTQSPYYAGRGGIMGDRAGNFAVQNSDFLLAVGSRLNVYQTGYQMQTWARDAYKVMVDIDEQELSKPTLHIDLPLCMDAGDFIRSLTKAFHSQDRDRHSAWLDQCRIWKERYPVVHAGHYGQQKAVNVYAFMDQLSRKASSGSVTVVSNGSASVVGSQAYHIDAGQRFLMNCAMSSMGYGLPAAIGAAAAGEGKDVICIEGDGSLQMNIQELATLAANRFPVKVFLINNGGYHQIRQTQRNVFPGREPVGIGPESGDLCFPDHSHIAKAYGLPYERLEHMGQLAEKLEKVLSMEGCCICEVFCDTEQGFEPKSATKRLDDGTLVSPPLEDLYPFLPREELKANMYVALVE